LFVLLGIQDTHDPIAQMDPQVKRQRTLDAIRSIVLRESMNQPMVVIFEDLHWIDEQTQALLDLLADSIAAAKILLLVNYRPEYSDQWNSKTYYSRIRLNPLGDANGAAMIAALLGEGVELKPLKRLVIERTGGNPFFYRRVRTGAVRRGCADTQWRSESGSLALAVAIANDRAGNTRRAHRSTTGGAKATPPDALGDRTRIVARPDSANDLHHTRPA
jgi:predicted ATPase